MVTLGATLLILPLYRIGAVSTADGEQRNVAIARQRLAELKQQLQDGGLSEEQFAQQYLELQQSLNDDLDLDDSSRPTSGTGRWVIPVVGLLLPLLSLSIYLLLGDANALQKAELQASNERNLANIQAAIPALIERLKQNPGDREGWLILGRSYLFLQQFQNAADVFAQLYRHQPDNLEVLLSYANSLAMARNGQMAGEPAMLVYKALKLSPDNIDALWLAGMAKVEEGDAITALSYWQKLAELLPADSESLGQVKQAIAEVKVRNVDKPTPAASVSIPVRVELQDSIKTNVQPQQTLFVYAQAAQGPKMPLAIVRKQVADLPLDVTLNDTMAVQPNLHLSEFKRLKIVARISKSGNASTQIGDFIGSAEIELSMKPISSPVNIIINQEVK